MARTIGQQEKAILQEELLEPGPDLDRDIDRELERTRREGTRRTQEVQYNAWLGKGLKWYTNPQGTGIGYDSAIDAINAQRMAAIVNDDNITIDEEMVDIINDPDTKVVDGEITRRMSKGRDIIRRSGQFARANLVGRIDLTRSNKPKQKRKPSKYQKELGKQLKMLKKKHPRTKVINLMKRAHRATKKALK